HVGHAEIGAYATNFYRYRGLAGEAFVQRADVRRGAADIDDDCILYAREEGGAAHRVGRARGEGEDREFLGELGIHQGAVVLGEVEAAPDAGLGDRLADGLDHVLREVAQAGVHDRRVLAFEQADAADIARQRDVDAGQGFGEDFAGLLLELAGHGGEDGGDGD